MRRASSWGGSKGYSVGPRNLGASQGSEGGIRRIQGRSEQLGGRFWGAGNEALTKESGGFAQGSGGIWGVLRHPGLVLGT